MKRVVSFVTTGLFVTGLAVLPMTVRADPAATGAKDGKPTSGATMTPSSTTPASGVLGSAAQAKKPADKTATTDPAAAAGKTTMPGTAPAATGGTATHAPVKNPS